MIQLIKLEWKKYGILNYIRNAIILIGFLCIFLFAICYLGIANNPETGVPHTTPRTFNVTFQVEFLTNISFLVFTSVMLATFIFSAYKDKTINLMFSYPIKRQKILISKILAVWIFNFIALVGAKLLIYAVIFAWGQFTRAAFPINYNMLDLGFYIQIIVKAAVTVTISFIALFIGKITKSSKAIMIASILLYIFMNGAIGNFTLADNAIIPIILMIVSLICAFISICNVESRDVN